MMNIVCYDDSTKTVRRYFLSLWSFGRTIDTGKKTAIEKRCDTISDRAGQRSYVAAFGNGHCFLCVKVFGR